MSNRFLKRYIVFVTLFLITGAVALYYSLPDISNHPTVKEAGIWDPPDISNLPNTAEAALVRYGKELIANTALYLGPKGTVGTMSNGMNCQNCHLQAGTRVNGNCFALVACSYPKFKARSGLQESIEFRINDCMERSLNGRKLDSNSREMRAFVSYLKWLGRDVPKKNELKGMGIPQLPFLSRAASPASGKTGYANKCQRCHGINGEGLLKSDSSGYLYPPLWGQNSYNMSAGIYLISKLAGYIKFNMPYTDFAQEPQVSDDEAWDIAAYICSQPRPEKYFAADWPVKASKPVDYPFPPYADSFSPIRHKFGPFAAIKKEKEKAGK